MTKDERLNFFKKLDTQTVFFRNDFKNAVFKSVPGSGYFVKLKGEAEFKAKPFSIVVNDAILVSNQITKEQYELF